ncbi:MAG: YhjD/YihY/BrkB family envelope integrity protein [Bacteroidales bacterium]
MNAKKESKYWKKIKKAIRFVEHDIWYLPLSELTPRQTFLIKQLRILVLAVKGFYEDKIHLRASALTYYTILGIVPIVGLAFGIAKGFGLEQFLEQQLRQTFAGRDEVLDWVLSFSQSMLQTASGGMVAGVGLIILLYTIMWILSYIEESFNDIWQIKKSRSLSRKVSDYFAMMFIAPIFLILAGASTVFMNTQIANLTQEVAWLGYLGPIFRFFANLVPYLLVWIMFLILYLVMPNTKVSFRSALIAAIIAGTMFQLAQWGYLYFQIGVSRYNTIYGSFAALPLLMFFLRIAWLIVLFGAELSFANQNVENYEFESDSQHISPFNKKLLALYVLHLLILNFVKGVKPMNSEQVANELKIPNKLVRSILNDLTEVRLINETKTDFARDIGYQPAMDPNQINVRMVLERLDKKGVDILVVKPSRELDILKGSLKAFSESMEASSHNILLKDLAKSKAKA